MTHLHSFVRKVSGLLPFLLVAALAGCTEEKIVEVERPPFNEPADPSSGFLGYYDVDAQQTTCGNCHADYQGTWAETGHAVAYATLKANAGAQPFCYSCHTISQNGNVATGTVGHDKVQDETYYDVQCESCHGPGLAHVEGVNAGTVVKPLASMGVGVKVNEGTTTVEDATAKKASCAACHEGAHHPYVDQWADSRHAWIRSSPTTRPAPNSCAGCHEGRGALAKWGNKVSWSEGPWTPTLATMQPLTCVVCHDPHGNDNTGNLRYPIDDPDETVNLCMKCHAYRGNPSATSLSPHGVQGPMMLGFAGYRPPNFSYNEERIYGSHASPTANPRLCAGCHVVRQTFNATGGAFQLQSVGHLFKPMPCLDAQGNPTGDDSCDFSATTRTWKSCTGAGCHATAQVAANAFNTTKLEVQTLVDILFVNKGGGSGGGGVGPALDPFPIDEGYLPRIKAAFPGEWQTPTTLTPPEGCEFNARTTGGLALAAHPDGSKGTHNPFLYRALLSACISYLRQLYPALLPAPPAEAQAIIDRFSTPLGMTAQRDAGR